MTSCSPGQPFSRSWYSTMSTNSKYWFFGLCGWGAKGTQRSILCQYIRCSHLKLSNYLSEAKDVISSLLWVQIDNQSLEKLTCFSCFPFSTALLSTFFPFNFWPHQCPRDSRESGTRELILLRTNATTKNTYVSVWLNQFPDLTQLGCVNYCWHKTTSRRTGLPTLQSSENTAQETLKLFFMPFALLLYLSTHTVTQILKLRYASDMQLFPFCSCQPNF